MSLVAAVQGVPAIPTTTISGAGTTTGAWIPIRSMAKVAFVVEWTGTLAGTMSYEVSVGKDDPTKPGNPVASAAAVALTLPSGFSAGNPNGSAGNFVGEFVDLPEAYIRPKFAYTSGSGNLTVTASAKGA